MSKTMKGGKGIKRNFSQNEDPNDRNICVINVQNIH